MKCNCGKTVDPKPGKSDRLPTGWHRAPQTELPLCPKCWGERYVLRAVTIPVVGPASCEWPELRAALKTAWQRATRLTNLAVQELLKRDVVRTAEMTKLPPMPAGNLYQACMAGSNGDYAGWSQSAAAILRQVEAKYRARRYERIWLGQTSLPNARYPQPYPIHNASWAAAWHENGERVPHVTVTLPEVGRVTLRLRGGHEFRRQLAAFAQIVDGTAVQGELVLLQQRVNGGDHRNGTTERDGAGVAFQTRIMAKIVAWLPRQAARELDGTLFVHTDTDSLLVALDSKDNRLWIHNADHIRRWVSEYQRKLNRWADDQKAEQRPVASFTSRREAAVHKQQNRMDSATHEAAAQLVGFAARRKFAAIRYDDSEKGFCGKFPWDRLKRLVVEKADACGINVEIVASAPVAQETPGPLATT
jgi:hypothetical protein